MVDVKRGSGRTTRMLFEAGKATLNCRQPQDRIYIIVHSINFIDYIRHELRKLFSEDVYSKIVVLYKGSHLVKRVSCTKYQCVAALYNDRGTFVDHHVWYDDVIEAHAIIEEYAKYDI